jgi:hypothetical protein
MKYLIVLCPENGRAYIENAPSDDAEKIEEYIDTKMGYNPANVQWMLANDIRLYASV